VATHASDLAVALVAADAEVHVQGPAGERTMLLDTFYREPGSTPHIETSIDHGDLVVAVSLPALPGGGRSVYLKVRERASYEFALVSVAASAEVEDGVIGEARVALGGVATRPWRAREIEARLAGVALDDRAAMREPAPLPSLMHGRCATTPSRSRLVPGRSCAPCGKPEVWDEHADRSGSRPY